VTEDRPEESPAQRADRNFGDLLQELRVAQTGVQFLFAFLLTAPLQAGFTRMGGGDRALLVVDILVLAAAAVCLIAPVAWHRALFRRHLKDQVVDAANRLARAGLTFLAVGIVLSITLAVSLVTPTWVAVLGGAGIAALAVMLWLVLPLRHRRALPDR
jgi:high-affinity Fe2+/Pb2+ permease